MATSATRALDLVTASGVAHHVHRYDPPARHGRARDDRPNYGSDAATALGVEPSRVIKTLVAVVDDRMVLALVPADLDLDLGRLALACGGRRASLAEPSAAERATGYVVGGISPLGSRRPLRVVVETAALGHRTVFVSAGRRGLQLELAPDDLVRLCDGISASIARDDRPG